MRRTLASMLSFLVAACGGGAASSTGDSKGSTGAGGAGGAVAPCPADVSWAMKAAPGDGVDSDGDGWNDCQEAACGSDPKDPASFCYACGWKHNDPGTLVTTGAKEGDVITNLDLIHQCKEAVKLWDFAGEYHILFMTAAW